MYVLSERIFFLLFVAWLALSSLRIVCFDLWYSRINEYCLSPSLRSYILLLSTSPTPRQQAHVLPRHPPPATYSRSIFRLFPPSPETWVMDPHQCQQATRLSEMARSQPEVSFASGDVAGRRVCRLRLLSRRWGSRRRWRSWC